VVDGSGSEDSDAPRRKKKVFSESEASDSDSDYGKKKKKKAKGKLLGPRSYFGRPAVTYGKKKGGASKRKKDESSDDSEADYRPKKKSKSKIKKSAFDISHKNVVESSAGRRTRGVKIDYSLIQGSDDSDEKKADEGPKGKGKGPRKWDGSDDEFKVEKSEEEHTGHEEVHTREKEEEK